MVPEVDLSTTLGPLRLKNPVIAASGESTMTLEGITACLDAGAGAVVAKSINESPAGARQLNIADYALLDVYSRAPDSPDDLGRGGERGPGGVVDWAHRRGDETLLCRSGLAQSGLEDWLAMLDTARRHAERLGAQLFGSITLCEVEPAAELARQLSRVTNAVELNVGAPHSREAGAVRQLGGAELVRRCTRTVREGLDVPLIVKLPGQCDDPAALAAAAREGGADVVAMIGRFNGFWPDLATGGNDPVHPALGSWGAVGNAGMLPVSLYWVSKTFAADPTLPLVGTNGARDGADVARFVLSGASAVELASAVLLAGPPVLGHCVRQLAAALGTAGYRTVRDALGDAVRHSARYADIAPCDTPPRPWETAR